ncbi:putative bifunctional diguanylate cyclase/phosphodiesterase [Rugamonas sp. DEMB1]|uniref:putative bifunctional diguanylate cyclase/phosphodiesterase n=1 Tax=Rugamonas sp. DEMB1 TaxID=3039386 RepID=UPI0024470912|nr:EAL domain-containing protein [Rugamonas sp. DEMB1]WGG53026.1 EAL domain-containing protein [Rugamonas sp. DEMB1]
MIDDDPFLRLLARDALEKLGLRVAEAADGAAGLARIAAAVPDIILLDVIMPDMSGFEVCRRARRLAGAELTPILMLTSLEDIDSINQAYEAGATDFITKPINWPILGHRVRYILKAAGLLSQVAQSDLQLAKAQRLTAIGSWEWRVEADQFSWSAEMYRICAVAPGGARHDFAGLMALVHEADRARIGKALRAALRDGDGYDAEHRIVRPDGSERIVHGKGSVSRDAEGRALAMSGTLQDITARKQAEARIDHLANYDALTDLPNRNLLSERTTQLLAMARRSGQQLTMLFLDLDGFKFVNDCFGHPVGDGLLRAVARRLQGAIREGDTVARLGGDEFVFLLPGLADSMAAHQRAQDIVDAFAVPFVVEQRELHISASVGVCIHPADGDSIDALLKNADVAMYHAKESGRNCFRFYAGAMSRRVEQRVALEHALRAAVEGGQFEVHYQPKIGLRDGRVGGVEALVRWRRPGHGMVPPDQFIGLAEDTGLIVPIGEWVLRSACAQARAWHAMGFDQLSVAVNLSARQFGQHSVADLVRRALADSGLAPRHLELELTESVLMSDTDAMLRALRDIKALGVTLTLDDFGTGYSSLSYLKRFPIDVLKIDRSFVADVTSDPDAAMLTKSIILLAHALKMGTVAEGVETEGQLDFLADNDCDAVQGYYFSRPLAADALTDFLRERR